MRLSRFQGARVVTEAGERLGHVWEVHSSAWKLHEARRETRPVETLVCGRRGLLERLGWREPSAYAIPWEAVVGRRGGRLLVRGRADDYDRLGPARRARRRR